jgi:hypothetical protein
MKKFFYILLIAVSSSIVISSCTDEEVSPKTETDGTAGGGTGDTGKP